jgi:hypothetical protein
VTDGHVEIRYVIPTTSSSTKTRFCHLRTDYFHDVALPVAHRIHPGRPATPGTPPGTGGLLVGSLRDGVGDAAGPQRRPVGPTAVGLVPGQLGHPSAGSAPTTRAGHSHGVHQPNQLAGVGILAGREPGHQVPTAAVADGVERGGQPAP